MINKEEVVNKNQDFPDGFVEIKPDVWKPETQDNSRIGVLVERQNNVGPNNSMIYYFENSGEKFCVWGSSVLDKLMKYVNTGDLVMIKYCGKEKNDRGQEVNIYRIATKKGDA